MFGLRFIPMQTKFNPNFAKCRKFRPHVGVRNVVLEGTATGAQVAVSYNVWHVLQL